MSVAAFATRACALVAAITLAHAWRAPAPLVASVDEPATVDHYVRVRSTVPSMVGQVAALYVRERALTRTELRGRALTDRVVQASREWLERSSVNGTPTSVVKLGY